MYCTNLLRELFIVYNRAIINTDILFRGATALYEFGNTLDLIGKTGY